MKFQPGSCLSIKSNNIFFAGIITIANDVQYEIVLIRFMDTSAPGTGDFINAELFCANMKLGDQSMSSLDVITISPAYADFSKDITFVHYLNIPPFSPAVGFHPIEELTEISPYYEQAIGFRNGTIPPDPNDPMSMLTEKTFIAANEFFPQQQASNIFPTVKLYRHRDGANDFCQIWGNSEEPGYLVVHWGRIGEKSLFLQEKDVPLQELQTQYNNYIDAQKTAGYQPAEFYHSLILQLQTDDSWGSTEDLDFRNELWNELDPWLFWSGNGQVSGGDIGSGTVNLFIDVVSPETAVAAIKAMLAKKQITRRFQIALQDEENEARIIYPEKNNGEFFF